jgi:D-glycero-D-manno-heptose 1,7-bisphosphate phosphatase
MLDKIAHRRPAAFLDRDGVLNLDTGFVHHQDHFVWVDDAKEAVKRLNDLGFLVFVVTNQSGVARGLYKEEAVLALHAWMQDEFRAAGAHIDGFHYCPHHPEGIREGLRKVCHCRKPQPGMLLQAMESWPVDTSRSFLIGDRDSDIEAAEAAGVRGFLFTGGSLLDRIETILAGMSRP